MKTFTLKQGTDDETIFQVEEATKESLYALPIDHLIALAENGIANWGYRKGARKKNNGQTFTLAEIAKDIMESGTREGEPSKADVAKAEEIFRAIMGFAKKEYPDNLQAQDAFILTRIGSKVEINGEKQGYNFREPAAGESLIAYLAEWLRHHRLHVARAIKKSSETL